MRVSRQEGSFVSTSSVASVTNLSPGQDFWIESEIIPVNLQAAALNRIGLIISGVALEPSLSSFDPANDNSYYHAGFYPRQSGSVATIRIREGLNGPTLVQEDWNGKHPTAANPDEGLGSHYQFRVDGQYTESGELNLLFTLTDSGGFSQSISTTITEPLNGNIFGIGARLTGQGNPIFDCNRFAISFLGEEMELSYNDWRSLYFSDAELLQPSISGPTAAPAGDRVPNLLKFAFGIPPKTPVTINDLTSAEVVNGKLHLTYTQVPQARDIDYTIEFSSDLIDWSHGEKFTQEVNRIEVDGKYRVTVQADPAESNGKVFLRLRISEKQ